MRKTIQMSTDNLREIAAEQKEAATRLLCELLNTNDSQKVERLIEYIIGSCLVETVDLQRGAIKQVLSADEG